MGNAKGKNHKAGRVSIATVAQLRKQLVTIWNDLREGTISTGQAKTFATLGNAIRKCLVAGDLEVRMNELEAHFMGRPLLGDDDESGNSN